MSSHSPAGHDSSQPPTGVLRRAAWILDVFESKIDASTTGLNLAEVVAATGLPQSSVHRALEQMVVLRWLHREGMEYRLGMRLAELGSAAVDNDALRLAALPSLRWLHHRTGCVVQLGVLEGDDVVYLEKIGGESVPAIRTRAGSRVLARSSTIGAALLALNTSPVPADPDIMKVRQSRIAYKRDGCLKGFSCLAAPIGPRGRDHAAAISIFGVGSRVGDDRQLRMPLQSSAAAIWRRLNAPASPPERAHR